MKLVEPDAEDLKGLPEVTANGVNYTLNSISKQEKGEKMKPEIKEKQMNTNKQKVIIPNTPVSVGKTMMKLYRVDIEGIDMKDYGDFCDAHITYAEIDDPKTGERRELTEQEIEDLDPAYVQEYIWDYLY